MAKQPRIQADTPIQNIGAYALIEKRVRELRYGQMTVTFTVRVHDKVITDITIQEFKKFRLDKI